MNYLKTTAAVRKAFGERNAAALSAGVGLPEDAQCYLCGKTINLLTAGGRVTLSAMVAIPTAAITLFAHEDCGPSRVFDDPEELARIATKEKPEVATHEGRYIPNEDGTVSLDNVMIDGQPARIEL